MSEIPKTVAEVLSDCMCHLEDYPPCDACRYGPDVQLLLDRVKELEESEAEYTTQWREILDEPCDGKDDRVHCTCVPDLKLKIRALTAENATLRAEVERLRELLAEATELVEDGVSQGCYRQTIDGKEWLGSSLSAYEDGAEFLVAAGRWEQHPEMGWLYRRKETT